MRTAQERQAQQQGAGAGHKSSWRDVLPIHPAAELFPMMGADELRALGQDIKRNGLLHLVIVTLDNDGRAVLIDGRNRLDAMESVGIKLTDGERFDTRYSTCPQRVGDPYTFVVSANIHRRHLTAEQKRDLIAKLIEAKPEQSNRQVAKRVKADDKTVAKVRREMEARSEIPNVSTRTDSKGRRQPAKKPKPQTEPQPPETTGKTSAPAAAPARDDIGPHSQGEVERLRVRQEELDNEARRQTVAGTGCLAYPYQTLLRAWEGAPDDARQQFMTKVGLIADPFHIPEFMRREPVTS